MRGVRKEIVELETNHRESKDMGEIYNAYSNTSSVNNEL